MKITIDKIGGFELKDIEYLSNSIFRFKIDAKKVYRKKIKEVKELLSDFRSRYDFQELIKSNNYQNLGSPIELINRDLKHTFDADYYYTNGQNIISLVKNLKGWEVGKFKSIKQYRESLDSFHPLLSFRLTSMNLDVFKIFESAEFFVVHQLSQLEITKLPLDNDSEVIVQELYPDSVLIDFGYKKYKILEIVSWDSLSRKIEDEIIPNRLRTCLNCKYFHFSGMSHDMSSGSKGYCFFVKDQIQNESMMESVTHIWNWCGRFEIIDFHISRRV